MKKKKTAHKRNRTTHLSITIPLLTSEALIPYLTSIGKQAYMQDFRYMNLMYVYVLMSTHGKKNATIKYIVYKNQ